MSEINIWTIGNDKRTPEMQALESQYCYLEEIFDPYIRYLKNNNGMVKAAHFIDDFEPIGEKVISDMEEAGIAKRMVHKERKIDDFMLIPFESWSLWK